MSKKDSLYKYTRLEFLNSVLHNGIFASSLAHLNDPYECINTDKTFKVVCLSRSRNKKLMWSHYANGHRGCSVKISLPDNYGEPTCDLRKVVYSSKLVDKHAMNEAEIIESLFVKDKKWDYELEVRAVYNPSNPNINWKTKRGNTFYQAQILQVDFGCFSEYDPHYLDALIALRDYNSNHKKKIKVRKYKMSDRRFEFILDDKFNYEAEIARIINGED